MTNILNQKYPAPKAELRSVITALLFGLFIGLFLLFFEPFDINLSAHSNKTYEVLFFGVITTGVLLLFLYLLPLLLPKVFADTHWQAKHQILFYFIVLFVIATCNGIYTNYINNLSFSWANYWWIINRTFVLGGIPLAFITLIDQQRKAKQNIAHAASMLDANKEFEQIPTSKTHQITTDLKNEIIHFQEKDFLYALAIGNYIDLFVVENEVVKKETFRLTLSSFEAQVASSSLVRCHRSYVVNLKKVENITGNAQGLKLSLKNQLETVPVSRKYIPIVKQFFSV